MNTSILQNIAPYLTGICVCVTIICVSLVLYRAYTLNTSQLVFIVASIAVFISTLFFYAILWLCLTILSPKENHFAQVSIAFLLTGLAPAIALGACGYKSNQPKKENQNE